MESSSWCAPERWRWRAEPSPRSPTCWMRRGNRPSGPPETRTHISLNGLERDQTHAKQIHLDEWEADERGGGADALPHARGALWHGGVRGHPLLPRGEWLRHLPPARAHGAAPQVRDGHGLARTALHRGSAHRGLRGDGPRQWTRGVLHPPAHLPRRRGLEPQPGWGTGPSGHRGVAEEI